MATEYETPTGPINPDVIADQTHNGQIIVFKSAEVKNPTTNNDLTDSMKEEIMRVVG